MLSHVAYPAISGDQVPASLSPDVISLLREELSFDGVILTDAMDMKAITGKKYQVPQASLEAINAGVDLLLITSPKQAQSTHAKLVESVASNTLSMERVDQSVRRVLTLKAQNSLTDYPPLAEDIPDLEQHDQLAITAGEKSVTLFKDQDDLVPIPDDIENILIVGPIVPDWFFYTGLEDTLEEMGKRVDFLDYPPPWDGLIPPNDTQEKLKQLASMYDLVIALTWQSHINHILFDDPWQIEMVNGLVETGIPLIVVAMKSPTDISDFPRVGTYLGTFGTNEGAMNYLIGVLVGLGEAMGKNPLPDLPLK
jgi:beta-N-acetylhexosaminidase